MNLSKIIIITRQKKLEADPEAIQQVEFIIQLKNIYGINADGRQSLFILVILEKIKEIFLRKFNSLVNNDKLLRSES